MPDPIERNKQFACDLFDGKTSRPAFHYRPPLIPLKDVGDFTLSSEPIANWVPWVGENYRRQCASLERHQDDSVPLAKLSTGTQIFAKAFGCQVHIPPDDNPCALPMLTSAAEAD